LAYSLRLHLTYRAFSVYLAVALIRAVVLLPFSSQSRTYYAILVATQPLMWLHSAFWLSASCMRRGRGGDHIRPDGLPDVEGTPTIMR